MPTENETPDDVSGVTSQGLFAALYSCRRGGENGERETERRRDEREVKSHTRDRISLLEFGRRSNPETRDIPTPPPSPRERVTVAGSHVCCGTSR